MPFPYPITEKELRGPFFFRKPRNNSGVFCLLEFVLYYFYDKND